MKKIIIISLAGLVTGLFFASLSMAGGNNSMGMKSTQNSDSQMMDNQHKTVGTAHLNNTQVRELQRLLTDKGFDAGPADGVIGTKTKQALRDYQTSQGLAVTGQADRATLRSLATDTETQEFFGLSPEFDELHMRDKGMMDQGMMDQDHMDDGMMDQDRMDDSNRAVERNERGSY